MPFSGWWIFPLSTEHCWSTAPRICSKSEWWRIIGDTSLVREGTLKVCNNFWPDFIHLNRWITFLMDQPSRKLLSIHQSKWSWVPFLDLFQGKSPWPLRGFYFVQPGVMCFWGNLQLMSLSLILSQERRSLSTIFLHK